MATSAAHIDMTEGAAPATPGTGEVRVYAKTDGLLYSKDDAGTETLVSGGAGGGASLGAWTAYTPTWGSGSPPTLGNGTLTGRYKALDSKTYLVRIHLVWGSTTSDASGGAWSFALPAAAHATGRQMIPAHILDSGTDNKLAAAWITAGGSSITQVVPEGGNAISAGIPMTWANGDELNIEGYYEVA